MELVQLCKVDMVVVSELAFSKMIQQMIVIIVMFRHVKVMREDLR